VLAQQALRVLEKTVHSRIFKDKTSALHMLVLVHRQHRIPRRPVFVRAIGLHSRRRQALQLPRRITNRFVVIINPGSTIGGGFCS
jgi:hypothetical protein